VALRLTNPGVSRSRQKLGAFSDTLLVSNNTGTGSINAFNAVTGQFVGTLRAPTTKLSRSTSYGELSSAAATRLMAHQPTFFTAGPNNNNPESSA